MQFLSVAWVTVQNSPALITMKAGLVIWLGGRLSNVEINHVVILEDITSATGLSSKTGRN
jgi:hypothetical protein